MATTKPPIMNALRALIFLVPLLFLGTTTTTTSAAPAPAPVLHVLGLTAVPDGHYLLNLQQGGRERRVNLTVEAGALVRPRPR